MFRRAFTPTTGPGRYGLCSWNAAGGNGSSVSKTATRIFPIDSRSYKFNPIIVQKGGKTDAISTAFMRRKLEDWERAEDIATPYSRQQVERFSPNSRAILEIQSARDLEILEKIYANGVLLGDDGPDGWGIKYTREFDMTNDSHLFPPRPEWEAKGYRPDEYSRWLLGDWRPMEELWEMLRVDPTKPEPAEIELEEWLFDTSCRTGTAGGRGAVCAWALAETWGRGADGLEAAVCATAV